MAGFLYYIEGAKADLKIEALRSLGLGYAFDTNGDFTASGVSRGPGDLGAGVVLTDMKRLGDRLIGLYPDKQTWRIIPRAGDQKLMVGHYKDDRPMPADLQRAEILDGHFVRLEDGNDWLIPVARGVGEIDGELVPYDKLPHTIGLGNDGSWSRDGAISKYGALWTLALRWWDELQRGLTGDVIEDSAKVVVSMEFNDIADGAVEALTTNYRLHKAEVSMLGLFSDRSMYQVMHALVDMPTIEAFAKKKLRGDPQDTCSTNDGDKVAIPDTSQA